MDGKISAKLAILLMLTLSACITVRPDRTAESNQNRAFKGLNSKDSSEAIDAFKALFQAGAEALPILIANLNSQCSYHGDCGNRVQLDSKFWNPGDIVFGPYSPETNVAPENFLDISPKMTIGEVCFYLVLAIHKENLVNCWNCWAHFNGKYDRQRFRSASRQLSDLYDKARDQGLSKISDCDVNQFILQNGLSF